MKNFNRLNFDESFVIIVKGIAIFFKVNFFYLNLLSQINFSYVILNIIISAIIITSGMIIIDDIMSEIEMEIDVLLQFHEFNIIDD
jgi:hypothetical protein